MYMYNVNFTFFDIVHVHLLRNVHVHFTTSVFLTLYMYISCLKNVHVQLDNFSIPMLNGTCVTY